MRSLGKRGAVGSGEARRAKVGILLDFLGAGGAGRESRRDRGRERQRDRDSEVRDRECYC